MLLLFAGSQSSPAPRNTAAHSCLANKEQLSSREAGLTFQRSPPAANATTAPRHHPPTPAQAEPTPHWAAPLTCQELGLPQGVILIFTTDENVNITFVERFKASGGGRGYFSQALRSPSFPKQRN